jgi:hypothetical protein
MLDGSPYPSTHIQLSKSSSLVGGIAAAENCELYVFEERPSVFGRTTQDRLVEIAGIEPATSGLQSRRSPS